MVRLALTQISQPKLASGTPIPTSLGVPHSGLCGAWGSQTWGGCGAQCAPLFRLPGPSDFLTPTRKP